jgi:hypothetical protein
MAVVMTLKLLAMYCCTYCEDAPALCLGLVLAVMLKGTSSNEMLIL